MQQKEVVIYSYVMSKIVFIEIVGIYVKDKDRKSAIDKIVKQVEKSEEGF